MKGRGLLRGAMRKTSEEEIFYPEKVVPLLDVLSGEEMKGGIFFAHDGNGQSCSIGRVKKVVIGDEAIEIHLVRSVAPIAGKKCWDTRISSVHSMNHPRNIGVIHKSGGCIYCLDMLTRKPIAEFYPASSVPPGRADSDEKLIKLGMHLRAKNKKKKK